MSIDRPSSDEEMVKQEEARELAFLKEEAMDLLLYVGQEVTGRGGLEKFQKSKEIDIINKLLQDVVGKEIETILASSAIPLEERKEIIYSKAHWASRGAKHILHRRYPPNWDFYTKAHYTGGPDRSAMDYPSQKEYLQDAINYWVASFQEFDDVYSHFEGLELSEQLSALEGAFLAQMGLALHSEDPEYIEEALDTLRFMGVFKDSTIQKQAVHFIDLFSKVRGDMVNIEEQSRMDDLVRPLRLFWDTKEDAYKESSYRK